MEFGSFRREEEGDVIKNKERRHRKGKEKNHQEEHVTYSKVLSLGAHPLGKIYET